MAITTDDARRVRRMILWGAVANVLLAVIKIICGYWGQSHALLADGVHSASDLIIDALVFFAAHYGQRRADEDHPYGHARIETIATMGLALLLIVFGVGIIINASEHFLPDYKATFPQTFVLPIVIFSIILKEIFYRWSWYIATQHHSALLRANAWHHRSDVVTSLIVLIGVGGALIGFTYLDAVAAIVVGVMIIKMGIELGWPSVRELVDTGVDEKRLQHFRDIITAVPGVLTLHQLRTRSMAGYVYADVHILVSPQLSVSEGHFIAEQVQLALVRGVDQVCDVTVHIDVEEDEMQDKHNALPTREILLPLLAERWQSLLLADSIEKIVLHYLDGKIIVEVYLPLSLSLGDDVEYLQKQYEQKAMTLKYIQKVKLFFMT